MGEVVLLVVGLLAWRWATATAAWASGGSVAGSKSVRSTKSTCDEALGCGGWNEDRRRAGLQLPLLTEKEGLQERVPPLELV